MPIEYCYNTKYLKATRNWLTYILCSHPFVDSASASGEVLTTSTPIWMELLDGLERLRTKKGQSSEVSQDNKTIGLMGQACYQAVSGNQSWKREGLVLSENIWFAEKLALSDQSMFRSLPSKVSGLGRFPWLWVGSHSSSRQKKRVDFIRDTWVLLLPSKNSSLSL